ncbi:hypothetical protein Tco_1276684 [Tanacetum coccineum]
MLRGLDQLMERKEDGGMYFIWVPLIGDVRTLIMDEAHASRYLVYAGADKTYYDLRDIVWWPCLKKVLLLDRLTKSAYFLAIREGYKTEMLAMLYIDEIVAGHGGARVIISDSNGRFTSWSLANYYIMLRDAIFDVPPFEALYGRNVGHPLCRLEIRESRLIGNILHVGNSRKQLGFEVGDKVILEVSSWKCVAFGMKDMLASRYVGPFGIIERIDANLHVRLEKIKVDKTLCFVEEPVEIIDREVKILKRSRIPIVKVHWNLKRGHEDFIKSKYPHLLIEQAIVGSTK